MKRIILFFISAVLMASCGKDDNLKTADVEVKISYFQNDFLGYRPDTGAKLFLYKHTGASYEPNWANFMTGGIVVESTGERVFADYTGTADADGLVKIQNVPFGKYLMVASGKGRRAYSIKTITISSERYTDTKNFTHRYEMVATGEPW